MNIQTFRNFHRLHKIIKTLIRYGFGGFVSELRIIPFFSTFERLLVFTRKGRGMSVPVRIRLVFEELGPTFIKLGQIASTRADLLPPDWIEEFKKLQDMVPSFPFLEAKKTIETSLNAPLDALFETFDEAPVASASIAQVHYATLKNGVKAAVKVRRAGIASIITADISVMKTIAGLLETYLPASRRYKPMEVVHEFERVIANELDLTIEGVNINRFGNMFKGDANVQIPRVYWDYTTEDVLTMERIYGVPIDEVALLRAKGLDVKKIAINGVELFFKQVFEFGFFHADLHPGNIFVRDDGVIIYLDFGIVGHLDRDLRKYLANMLYYLVRQDYYKMAALHRDMGLIGPEVNLAEFEEALRDIAEPIFGRTLEQISVSALLMKLIQTARRFNMSLQPNLLLLQKSMVIIEGVGRQLYPDINMWEAAKPLIKKWMFREKFSPKVFVDKAVDNASEFVGSVFDIPIRFNDLLNRTLREELKIGFVHHRLEPLTDELKAGAGRLAGAILAASLVIAGTLAIVFARIDAYTVLGLPPIGWIGYALAASIAFKTFGKRREKKV